MIAVDDDDLLADVVVLFIVYLVSKIDAWVV